MLTLWRKRGRDPELAPIATQYKPPAKMTPAELGTLIDGKPDMRDITASIVDLAVRGYLHIAETDNERFFGLMSSKDYTFTLKKSRDGWTELKQHERDLLDALFTGSTTSVSLSELKNKFYTHLPGLRDELYGGLVHDGFYTGPSRSCPSALRDPRPRRRCRHRRRRAAESCVGLGMQPLSGIAAGILSAIIVIAFGWFMPSRTPRGTRELEKVLGFREFLSRVEGDRLERMVKTPEMFERFLPYAMALGVEDTWAKTFEGSTRRRRRRTSGPGGVGTFRPAVFTHNLGVMSTAAATTMSSAPRSSGGSGFSGGSSGGGFGGGGGGGF